MTTAPVPRLRHAADRVLLSGVDAVLPGSALLILQNGTGLASALLKIRSDVRWDVFTMDHFLLTSLIDQMQQADDVGGPVQVHCLPDLPDGLFDTVLLPTSSRDASELTRDLLQQASDRICPKGRVIVSTDNRRDTWLHGQLRTLYGRVTVRPHADGVCYVARRRPDPARRRSFAAEFAFRDEGRLIRCHSRPGVFSHRRLDAGGRALIRSLSRLPSSFCPSRIVDMGCGCGAVAVAAALRYPAARILAVDSHARAVQAAEQTVHSNQVDNVTTMLSCHAVLPDEGVWDLYLTNPPYYSDHRISELFLQSARRSLRTGGRLHLVTRLTDWHTERMTALFDHVRAERFGDYDVIMAENRPPEQQS